MQLAHGLRRFGRIVRNAFARETLEVEPEPPPGRHRARTLARALFAIEDLPEDPPPPLAPRRRDALRALFAPEHLPEDPVEPARPSRFRWLAWLFRFESLDDPHP